MMSRPNLSFERVTMSSVPLNGISNHFLINDALIESRVCFAQVIFTSDIASSQLILTSETLNIVLSCVFGGEVSCLCLSISCSTS